MKLELITLAVVAVFVAAFAYTNFTGNHEWAGTDDQPANVIRVLTGQEFNPWFHSIWEPPSPEIESLLFALQAAVGSLIIGYFLGYYRGLAKGAREKGAQENARKAASKEQRGKEKGNEELDAQPAR